MRPSWRHLTFFAACKPRYFCQTSTDRQADKYTDDSSETNRQTDKRTNARTRDATRTDKRASSSKLILLTLCVYLCVCSTKKKNRTIGKRSIFGRYSLIAFSTRSAQEALVSCSPISCLSKVLTFALQRILLFSRTSI